MKRDSLVLVGGIFCFFLAQQGWSQLELPLRGDSGEMILGLGTLEGVAYSPDGEYISTCGSLGAFLWDANTGELIQRFGGHTQPVSSLAFSPDGRRLLTGSWDHTAKLWDVQTGQEIKAFCGHSGWVANSDVNRPLIPN